MTLRIDEKICLKHNLTIEEILAALVVKYGSDIKDVVNNLLNREILVEKNGRYLVTSRWNDEIDEVLLDSSGGIDNEERLLNLAKEMMNCFPQGLMPGTPYYYKGNSKEISLRLKKFFAQHGNYPDQKMIDATKRFVASFNGDYKYLPLLKYFISNGKKEVDEDGNSLETSQLADYLENEGTSSPLQADDWQITMRN